jgi:AAA+ superfamily predicted ATPase
MNHNSRNLSRSPLSVLDMNPTKFYGLVEIARSARVEKGPVFDDLLAKIDDLCVTVDADVQALAKANNALLLEVRNTSRRRKNPFETDQEHEDIYSDLRHTVSGESFMRVIFDVTQAIRMSLHDLRSMVETLRPGKLLLVGKKIQDMPESIEDLNAFSIQYEMNRAPLQSFIEGVLRAEDAPNGIVTLGRLLVDKLDQYHETLLHRHTVEGVLIHGDPIATDVALSVFENVDANGEIRDGKDPNEVSAYSVRKAIVVADAIKNGLVGDFIKDPMKLLEFMEQNLFVLWMTAKKVAEFATPWASKIRELLGVKTRPTRKMADAEFDQAVIFLRDLDPRNITFKDKAGILTAEERFAREFQNETLRQVVRKLQDPSYETKDLIQYVLERKKELHVYYQDENSFYVCKIGSGNPFGGEAPGSLTVVPGIRPVVDMDEIVGSGFDQVKEFVLQIRESARWHDLFLATSPSRSADKANCLLIGPQGCGKSEALRAVGGDKKSIGVYAQPSDFLTCWKGEAEKNPKRLFESALKIQKESNRQVFILIDEVDTILNDDHARGGFGATNLTTEFQQLMDGILQYPHIAVWAATNHPERIPMPMIRRFSKVAIVGELEQDDRVRLLKHFCGFLPVDASFSTEAWHDAAKRLEGVVGDGIRKIADHVWREKMSWLVRNHAEEAEKIVDVLNKKEKFQIGRFDSSRREALHAMIRPLASVRPKDVIDSIALHLDNVAFRAEIDTAVETYERSKRFLAGIRKKGREEQGSP